TGPRAGRTWRRPFSAERRGENAMNEFAGNGASVAGGGAASVADQVERAVRELAEAAGLGKGHILVIGASTSEVAGRRIGTAGSMAIAGEIWEGVERVRRERGFHAAYQCCEHLNRALVVERGLADADPRLVRV